jgi:hypothetical protein
MCLGNFRELKIGFVGRNRSGYDSEAGEAFHLKATETRKTVFGTA